jgi:hypothetical protein
LTHLLDIEQKRSLGHVEDYQHDTGDYRFIPRPRRSCARHELPRLSPWAAAQLNTHVRYADPVSLNGYYAHHGYAAQLPDYVSQQLVTPQFNDPGAQISAPQPGNAVEQFPPFRRRIAGWVGNRIRVQSAAAMSR